MQVYDVLPPKKDDSPEVYYDNGKVKVLFASKEYLLAMKSMVSRKTERDKYDAALLFNLLHLSSWLDIEKIV